MNQKFFSLFMMLLSMTLQSTLAMADGWNCDIFMHQVSDKDLAQVWANFGSIEREVLAGTKSPSWDDFNRLQTLVDYLKRYKTSLSEASKLTQFDTDLQAIKKTLMDDLKFDPDLSPMAANADTYIPGDYELRKIYRYYLDELNQDFPSGLLKLADIPGPKMDKAAIVAKAQELLSGRNAEIEKTLAQWKPEFKTWDDFQKYIDAQVNATPADSIERKIYEALRDPTKLNFSMRRPLNGRFWVSKSGFQNQTVTHTSSGALNLTLRNSAEANLLGQPLDVYQKFDSGVKPKYGFLQFGDTAGISIEDTTRHYGEDIYVFKYDNIKSRTTFTTGDSLDWYDSNSQNAFFGRSFTPVSQTRFLTPFLLPKDGGVLNLSYPNGFLADPNKFYNNYYVELQFFAPLDLDDVGEFIFTTHPPEGDFLKELQARGIKIKDGTKSATAPTDWTAPETDKDFIPIIKRAADDVADHFKSIPVIKDVAAAVSSVDPIVITNEQVLKIFPKADPADLHLTLGTGRIDLQKDVDFSYYIQSETLPNGTTQSVMIPMATSRLAPGWVSTPEWWTAHATEIADAKAKGLPMPRQDRHEVIDWLRQNNLSTNPPVYQVVNGKTTSMPLQDFLLEHLRKNAKAEDDSYIFYRGAVQSSELGTWESHTRPKGSRYWTPTASYAWRYARKQPGFLRSLLKNQSPVIRFKIPKAKFQSLVGSGDLTLGTELTINVHRMFDSSGYFQDPLGGEVYYGSGVFAPEIEIRATRTGADSFLDAFTGSVGVDELADERIELLQKAAARVKVQYPAAKSTEMLKNIQARIDRVKAEKTLLIAIRDKHPADEVKGLLAALPPGNEELTNSFDGDTIEHVVADYVAGKL